MRIVRKTNFRVEVEPEAPWLLSTKTPADQEKAWLRDTEAIAAAVRRHVDGAEHVLVRWTVEETCSHCGADWSDAPECCDAALSEGTEEEA